MDFSKTVRKCVPLMKKSVGCRPSVAPVHITYFYMTHTHNLEMFFHDKHSPGTVTFAGMTLCGMNICALLQATAKCNILGFINDRKKTYKQTKKSHLILYS